MARAALIAVSSALVGAVAGCGGAAGDGNTTDGSGLAAVTQAAYVTGQMPGYRLALTVTTDAGGHSLSVRGTGSINERGSEGTIDSQVAGQSLTEVLKRPYVYIKLPSAAGGLSGGKAWARANVNALSQSLGGGTFGASSTDPTQTLSFLEAAGSVTTVGSEAVRGVSTTRYHAVVDLARLGSVLAPGLRAAAKQDAAALKRITGATTLPIDVWIDRQHRVRRMLLTTTVCGPEGKIDESLGLELFDYGRQPAVTVPAPGQFADISEKLKSHLASSLQKLHC